jgi:hypothetical protein
MWDWSGRKRDTIALFAPLQTALSWYPWSSLCGFCSPANANRARNEAYAPNVTLRRLKSFRATRHSGFAARALHRYLLVLT